MEVITRDKTDAGVPAVQTLRNSIMAASFMATSAAAAPCSHLFGCALTCMPALCTLPDEVPKRLHVDVDARCTRSVWADGGERHTAGSDGPHKGCLAGLHRGMRLPHYMRLYRRLRLVSMSCNVRHPQQHCRRAGHGPDCVASRNQRSHQHTGAQRMLASCARVTMTSSGLTPDAAIANMQWKLASAEFMLLVCLLCFLQAIRLWSFLVRQHTFYRVCMGAHARLAAVQACSAAHKQLSTLYAL